jgi:hypothetical protein
VGIFAGDEIWEEMKNRTPDGMLYQDFYRFAMEKGLQPFKFTELANWLLDNNINLRNEFADSHIPKSYRVHCKSSFIKTRLNNMIRAREIEGTEKTKAQKNNQVISLYTYTLHSFLVALSLYDNLKDKKYDDLRAKHRSIFYNLAKSQLDSDYCVENEFYSKFLDKLYEQANFENFVTISSTFMEGFRSSVHTLIFPWLDYGDAYGFDQGMVGGNKILKEPQISSVVLETLNELDPESRELLFFQLKFGIEDHYYGRCSTKEFEKLRIKNISNENQVTIQTKCSKCGSCFPVTVNLDDLLRRHSGQIDESHIFPCPNCDSDTSNKSCKLIQTLRL